MNCEEKYATMIETINRIIVKRKKIGILGYGMNGMLFDFILRNRYAITPEYIIDNKLSIIREDILSVNEFLNKENKSDIIVVLTVENTNVAKELSEAFIECGRNVVSLFNDEEMLSGYTTSRMGGD